VSIRIFIDSNKSVLAMDLPKLISLPHVSAMPLKFSQVHPCGGTLKISNQTILVSQQSYLSHFLIFMNHNSSSAWLAKASSIWIVDGNVKMNLKLLSEQILVHSPYPLITAEARAPKSRGSSDVHTRLLLNHSTKSVLTYP